MKAQQMEQRQQADLARQQDRERGRAEQEKRRADETAKKEMIAASRKEAEERFRKINLAKQEEDEEKQRVSLSLPLCKASIWSSPVTSGDVA